MSNNDRIKNWRARRQGKASGDEPVSQAQSTAEGDIHAEEQFVTPAISVLRGILDALSSVPHATVAQRRAVYEALEADLEQDLVRRQLPDEAKDARRRQMRLVVRLLETDIRSDVDVFVPGYIPASLQEADERLIEGYARRLRVREQNEQKEARRQASASDTPFLVPLESEEAADAVVLRRRLAHIHATQRVPDPRSFHGRLASLIPLLLVQLHIIHNESRIAILWSLIGPAILLGLISSAYFITGTHYILGMDVPTFSLVGATTWIMFRQIIFRTSTSYVTARGLINLEGISPLAVALVQAFIFLVIYLVVFGILLNLGYRIELITLPKDWAASFVYVVLMGVGGMAIGVLFGSIATYWRFFLRLSPVIERTLQVFSAVFLVSEQLPEQYRAIFLWSPFAHGMQLLRSAYFVNYESSDASLAYFLVSLVFLLVIGLAAERLARPNVQPM